MVTEVGAARDARAEVLDELLAVAPVALVTVDREGRVVAAEGDGLRLAGLSPAVLLGRDLLAGAPAGSELATALRAALNGCRGSGTHALSDVAWEFATVPRRDGRGRVDGVHLLAFNIAERSAREGAERESAATTRFLATISHELRTPLNSILGFNQLMASDAFGTLSERQRRYVDNIACSGAQLLALVNELLDLAKVSSGAMEFDLRAVALRPAAAGVLDAVAPLASPRRVELRLESAGNPVVRADERRLGQAVLNLVANAIKFTPDGGMVTVFVGRRGEEAVLAVTDTGAGIAPEDQEAVFEEFRQLPLGAAAGGTGLGLSLARRLVEQMGGRLELTSALGAGSTFTVSLPLA